MKTRITEPFGIRHPIIRGGMHDAPVGEPIDRIMDDAEAMNAGRLAGSLGTARA